jgi:hypothetical protein
MPSKSPGTGLITNRQTKRDSQFLQWTSRYEAVAAEGRDSQGE